MAEFVRLIACKTCNGDAAMERSISRSMWAVECQKCGAATNSIYLKQEAISRWNGGEQVALRK